MTTFALKKQQVHIIKRKTLKATQFIEDNTRGVQKRKGFTIAKTFQADRQKTHF